MDVALVEGIPSLHKWQMLKIVGHVQNNFHFEISFLSLISKLDSVYFPSTPFLLHGKFRPLCPYEKSSGSGIMWYPSKIVQALKTAP